MSARNLIAAVAFVTAATLGAQTPAVTGTFVSTLGTDTVAVERYTRTGSKLEGDILYRFPRVRIVHYVADLSAGQFRGMSMVSRPVGADAAAPPLLSIVTLLADSVATIEVQRGGRPDTASSGRKVFRGRAVPTVAGLPPSYGLYEQVLALNPPVARDTMRITVVSGGAGPLTSLSLMRRARDTVVFTSSFNPGWIEVASVDASGRITGVDATATTVKTYSRRVGELDFDALARNWAAVETSRGRAGQMSPPDTVRSTVGAANIEIIYSRPSKRGRDVWGKVVEWNKPWRTGANAATQLTTSSDLVFGTTVIPAGKYTLWTLPSADTTKLIINSQTGQWGTEYDVARDVARLDMRQTPLARPVEQFTISIVPQGAAGTLRLSWDSREYSIPFRAR